MKEQKRHDTVCICGYVWKGHSNLFGKICDKCGAYLPPVQELPIIIENRAKNDLARKVVIDAIKKKIQGENNANSSR